MLGYDGISRYFTTIDSTTVLSPSVGCNNSFKGNCNWTGQILAAIGQDPTFCLHTIRNAGGTIRGAKTVKRQIVRKVHSVRGTG